MGTHEPLLPLWAMELLFDVFIYAWLFCLGATVGSFLNVVVYRLPRRKSLVYPGSFCPRCGHAIRLDDNIPIVSWLLLGGRCRDCREAISPRYLFVELACAVIFLVVALLENKLHGQSPWRFGRWLGSPQEVLPFWSNYALHVGLLVTLLGAALIDRDGFPTPPALFSPVAFAALVAPLVYAAVGQRGFLATWPSQVLPAVVGFVAGIAYGIIAAAAWAFGAQRGWPRCAPVAMLAAIGAVLASTSIFVVSAVGTALFAVTISLVRLARRDAVIPLAAAMFLAAVPSFFGLPVPVPFHWRSILWITLAGGVSALAALAAGRFAPPSYFAAPPLAPAVAPMNNPPSIAVSDPELPHEPTTTP